MACTDKSAYTSKKEKKITGSELHQALKEVQPQNKPLPGYEHENISRSKIGVCMDEVYPGVYIGNSGSAKNINYLKRVGITHVLNTAKGFEDYAGVNTNSAFYEPYNIKYLGLDLCDYPQANIAQYFDSSSHFIENALKDGGKVLVHCFMGMSRSSTITAAFLMIKRDMSARDALIHLRKSRHIFPNSGFLEALADLDYELARERENP